MTLRILLLNLFVKKVKKKSELIAKSSGFIQLKKKKSPPFYRGGNRFRKVKFKSHGIVLVLRMHEIELFWY